MTTHLAFGDGVALASSFAGAEPFPHVVIDAFLSPEVLDAVLAEFPAVDEMEQHFDNVAHVKSTSAAEDSWGETTRAVMRELNSEEALRWLTDVSGIEGLVADPAYLGGGLHQIRRGGKLNIHADFNVHLETGQLRRLNLLVYLNPGWDERWGGHLELWSRDMQRCVQRIAPIAGRAVLFATDSDAFHGHPDPLDCPEGVTRKSLALYYYTPVVERPERHSTLFQARPGSGDRAPRRPRRSRISRKLRSVARTVVSSGPWPAKRSESGRA